MTKSNITQYDNTAANNTDVEDVPLGENLMYPSHVNNAFREIMADLADINDGTVTLTSPAAGSINITGNITVGGTVDGRDVATDGAKLDGIEAGATADQTAAEIRALVESATDSNVFTDADHTKLNGIEAGATADQDAAEIRALVNSATDSNVFTDADHTKLDGVATGATNVSSLTDLSISDGTNGQVLTTDGAGTFTFEDSAGGLSGNVEMTGTLDMNNYDIYGVDQIFHHGDTNTYIQFHASDQFRVVTGGSERLEVNNSGVNVSGNPVATTQFNTVGSYCLAHHTSANASLSANANIGGSSLRAVGFFHLLSTQSSNAYYPEEDGTALSGSWRVMGEARDNSAPTTLRVATLLVRYA